MTKKITAIAIIAAVIIALAIAGWLLSRSGSGSSGSAPTSLAIPSATPIPDSPEAKEAKAFLTEIYGGQAEQAYQNETSAAFKSQFSVADFQSAIASDAISGVSAVDLTASTTADASDTVFAGTMTATDGQRYNVEVDLVQENGAWAVDGIRTKY